MPHTAIADLALAYVAATRSISSRVRPDSAMIASHGVARMSAATISNPCVCWAMKSTSSTRGWPASTAASSAARTAFIMPFTAAMSPPVRTW